MSSSSISSSNDIIPVVCDCGRAAVLKTSGTTINPGKQFWGCPIWQYGRKSCNFFEWEYERLLGIASKVPELMHEVDELKRIVEEIEKDNAIEKQKRKELHHQVEDLKNQLIVATLGKQDVGNEKKRLRKKQHELLVENNKLRKGNRIRDIILVVVILCWFAM